MKMTMTTTTTSTAAQTTMQTTMQTAKTTSKTLLTWLLSAVMACALALSCVGAAPVAAFAADQVTSQSWATGNTNDGTARPTDKPTMPPECANIPIVDISNKGTNVIDTVGVLNSSEHSSLDAEARVMSQDYGVGVYYMLVDDIGSATVRNYAKAQYIGNNMASVYGYSGILFLVAVESRDYVTITYGDGVTAFTDSQIEHMEKSIIPKLKSQNWSGACVTYLDMCKNTLSYWKTEGKPYEYTGEPVDWGAVAGGAILGGIIVGAIIAWTMTKNEKRKLFTAQEQLSAFNYADAGAINLTRSDDVFRTQSVVVTRLPEPEGKGGGFGGGSSFDGGGFGGSGGGKF